MDGKFVIGIRFVGNDDWNELDIEIHWLNGLEKNFRNFFNEKLEKKREQRVRERGREKEKKPIKSTFRNSIIHNPQFAIQNNLLANDICSHIKTVAVSSLNQSNRNQKI